MAKTKAKAGTKPRAITVPAGFVTPSEAARILGRSPRTVARLAEEGHIKMHRPPGCIPAYCRAALERLAPREAVAT